MLVVRRAQQRTVPWKNGGGVTTEVFVSPPGAGFDDLELRLSRAKVERDGPFSSFPGIDRSLVVLEGAGLRLTGECDAVLGPRQAPLVFAGERAIHAALLDGAVEDFNVMTRRAVLRHELSWLPVEGRAELTRRGSLLCVVVVEGEVTIGAEGLVGGDAVVLEEADAIIGGAGLGLRVDVFPNG